MMRLMMIVAVVLAAVMLGCGGTGSEQRRYVGDGQLSRSSGGGTGDHFTVTLAEYDTSMGAYDAYDATEAAEELRDNAREVFKSDDVWLERTEQRLRVNYGHYRKYEQARRAMKKAEVLYRRRLVSDPYQFMYVKELEQPDPPAPRDWELLNHPCVYSIEVATYYNVPEEDYYNRKADAVEGVRRLREAGDTAYFVHGQTESRVYIGCFPSNVVQQQEIDYGTVNVVNPLVKLKIEQRKYRYENGGVVYRVAYNQHGEKVRIPQPPVLVPVNRMREELSF